MPGVLRPYTLADVLATINQQSTATSATSGSVTGVGFFEEADEAVPVADSATATASAPAGWDAGVWGATLWQ